MIDVLFVTYGGGHVKSIIPVYNELAKRGVKCQVLSLTSSYKILKDNNIPFKTYEDLKCFFTESELGEIKYFSEKYFEKNYDINSGIPSKVIYWYIGINIWDLSKQFNSKQRAEDYYEKFGKKVFCPLNLFKRLLSNVSPKVIVVSSGQRSEKAAAIQGNDLGIQVVRIIDLISKNFKYDYKSIFCVQNNLSKRKLLEIAPKVPEKDIRVTGQPNLINRYEKLEESNFYENYQPQIFSKIVTLFSQPNLKDIEKIRKEYKSIALNNPKILFIWKLHPNEESFVFKSKIENLFVLKDINSSLLIEKSDLIITFFSTIGMQAITNDKNLLVINHLNEDYPVKYHEMGCAIMLTNLKKMEEVVLNSLYDPTLFEDIKNKRKKIDNVLNPEINISNIITSYL
ncbi:hypothetical protein ACQV2R_01525 [Facklamia sp. P12937]|uniref:hypothetical protein n=1 Tax=Facklamia sp. P12937 TaxID=3421949 RepID=UPI003D16F8BB